MKPRFLALTIAFATLASLGAACGPKPEPGAARPAKGGAQIWAENCLRCHNSRTPSSYSDAEWDVVGLHMRVRANLTGDEERAIVEFLKSAN